MLNQKQSLETLEGVKAEFRSSVAIEVIQDLENHGSDWYAHLQDIINHGCVSGTVSGLIYYNDTIAFHDKHEDEIDDMIYEFLQETGMTFEQVINGRFESHEITALKNFKAWFAFEHIASQINDFVDDMEDEG